jgi:hypothetical protein
MLFGLLDLSLGQQFFLGFMVICWVLWEIGKKAVSNERVQKGFLSWLFGR